MKIKIQFVVTKNGKTNSAEVVTDANSVGEAKAKFKRDVGAGVTIIDAHPAKR